MPNEDGSVYGIYLKEMIRMRKPVLRDLYLRLLRLPAFSGAMTDEDVNELLFVAEAMGIQAEEPKTLREFYRLKGQIMVKILEEMRELEPRPQVGEVLERILGEEHGSEDLSGSA